MPTQCAESGCVNQTDSGICQQCAAEQKYGTTSRAYDADGTRVELREGETRDDDSHAGVVAAQLAEADDEDLEELEEDEKEVRTDGGTDTAWKVRASYKDERGNKRTLETVGAFQERQAAEDYRFSLEYADARFERTGVTYADPHERNTECVVCGKDLTDPKNAGDPDENGDWVCAREHCRAVHDVPMTVERTVTYSDTESEKEIRTDGGTDRWDAPITERTDLYDRARQQWSDDAQLAKLSEEAAELSAVASRALNGQADPDAFLEELVDARLMIEQFAYCYSPDRIEPVVGDTIDDLEHRLDRFGGEPEIRTDGGQDETIVDPEEFDEPPVTSECPACGLTGDVPGTWDGLRIECKDCGERFTVRSETTESTEAHQ